MRQMLDMIRRSDRAAGESRQGSGLDEAKLTPRAPNDTGPGLLMAVLARENLLRAFKHVRANKGSWKNLEADLVGELFDDLTYLVAHYLGCSESQGCANRRALEAAGYMVRDYMGQHGASDGAARDAGSTQRPAVRRQLTVASTRRR